MKKFRQLAVSALAAVCIVASLSTCAYADKKTGLRSGSEIFEGVSRSEKEEAKVKEIYEDLIYRAYQFDEDLLLPELENMNDLDDIKIKYVQARKGFGYGQSLYDGPGGKARWTVKDACKVKVYAKYGDYSFVEVMMDDDDSEGTIAWIPTTYVVSKWNPELAMNRAAATDFK